jgi:hypothetical protein
MVTIKATIKAAKKYITSVKDDVPSLAAEKRTLEFCF